MIFNDLYKFSSVNVNSLSALSNKCVWFAKQGAFNDPFEGIYKLNSQYTNNQLLEFATSMVNDESNITITEAREQIKTNYHADQDGYLKLILDGAYKIHELKKNYARNIGMLSTSADMPDDPRSHVANMLMWSHYGDGLKGFCIHYDAKELYSSLKELNPSSIFATCKVDYDKKPREIDLLSASEEDDISYVKALQIKHEQWGYECECRIFCNQIGLQYFSRNSVKSIFIGDKMPSYEEALVI